MTFEQLRSKVQALVDEAIPEADELELRLAIAEIALTAVHEYDNEGQLVIYTGLYRGSNGGLFFGDEE